MSWVSQKAEDLTHSEPEMSPLAHLHAVRNSLSLETAVSIYFVNLISDIIPLWSRALCSSKRVSVYFIHRVNMSQNKAVSFSWMCRNQFLWYSSIYIFCTWLQIHGVNWGGQKGLKGPLQGFLHTHTHTGAQCKLWQIVAHSVWSFWCFFRLV